MMSVGTSLSLAIGYLVCGSELWPTFSSSKHLKASVGMYRVCDYPYYSCLCIFGTAIPTLPINTDLIGIEDGHTTQVKYSHSQ